MPRPLHILAADMGGTTSRFGHFTLEDAALTLRGTAECPTASLRHADDALAQAARAGLPPEDAYALAFAVAGPVPDSAQSTGGGTALEARFTNAPLHMDLRPLAARGVRVLLCNDFAAQAWATLAQPGEEALIALPGTAAKSVSISGGHGVAGMEPAFTSGISGMPGTRGAPPTPGVRGIVGAGTGLGTASLRCEAAGGWTACCAEGGHAAFPFRDGEETDYAAFVQAALEISYVTCEQVLSGGGLELLHRYLTGKDAPAWKISAAHLQTLLPTHPTLTWFGRFFGRMCRHWALNTLCEGGLYVTGGVAAKNPLLVCNPAFTEEFYDAPEHVLPFLRRVPVRVMRDGAAGLWGAARAAQARFCGSGAV